MRGERWVTAVNQTGNFSLIPGVVFVLDLHPWRRDLDGVLRLSPCLEEEEAPPIPRGVVVGSRSFLRTWVGMWQLDPGR